MSDMRKFGTYKGRPLLVSERCERWQMFELEHPKLGKGYLMHPDVAQEMADALDPDITTEPSAQRLDA